MGWNKTAHGAFLKSGIFAALVESDGSFIVESPHGCWSGHASSVADAKRQAARIIAKQHTALAEDVLKSVKRKRK